MDALSFILALAPILWLVAVLMIFKWPAWKAAIGSFAISAVLAFTWWHLPALEVATASLEGFLMALWPIVLVIIAAVFTYNLCVETGAMDVIGHMITSISSDRRILALLVAWCFGGFMEGMAGFGTAVAIPAGMLAGLGFSPVPAVLICLFANGAPTAYGSIGIPTASLASLTGLDSTQLAFIQMVQLAPFLLIAPFFIVMVAGRVPGGDGTTPSFMQRMHGMWGITAASAISLVAPALLVAGTMGPELTMIVGSICSLAVTAALGARAEKSGHLDQCFHMSVEAGEHLPLKKMLASWSCFILIFVLLLGTSSLVAPVHNVLAGFSSSVTVYSGANPGTLTFSWVNTPGVWIFVAALVGGRLQGASGAVILRTLQGTVRQMAPTVVTMLSVLGCAKVMGYSGMISSISAFCIAVTGGLFPLVAPWFGMAGTFVTGSGTSSGMLFGLVQKQAAEALALDPTWVVGLNSLGVAAGKMVSPQTLAIGMAAVRVRGKDAELMSAALPYALVFLVLMSAIGLGGATILG